jgi:hypothetical protein
LRKPTKLGHLSQQVFEWRAYLIFRLSFGAQIVQLTLALAPKANRRFKG